MKTAERGIGTGLMLAAIGSIAFSGKSIIIKLAYRYGVDAVTLIMYRMLFALPLFLAMAWWASKNKPPLSGRDWLHVFGLGFSGYYLASFLDFAGLTYITASLERLIIYLTPTLVLLLERVVFGRAITKIHLLGFALSYGGLLLVFGHEVSFAGSEVALGMLLVFGSAVSYALYLTYSGELVRRLGSLRLVGLATSVACVLCITQFVLLRPLQAAQVPSEVLWLSLLNATACTAVPVLLVMMAIERIGSRLTAQVGMVGPLSTILMGIWLLAEPVSYWLAAGTAMVITGIYVFSRMARG